METIIVTGCAGFIGAAVSQQLLAQDFHVVGIDNLNDYYDVSLKSARLGLLNKQSNFTFYQQDIADGDKLLSLFKHHEPQAVVHLAAQAGVRYSIENPAVYINSNIDPTKEAKIICDYSMSEYDSPYSVLFTIPYEIIRRTLSLCYESLKYEKILPPIPHTEQTERKEYITDFYKKSQ